jgi:hypothetical protein
LNFIKGNRIAETVARRRERQHLSSRRAGKKDAEEQGPTEWQIKHGISPKKTILEKYGVGPTLASRGSIARFRAVAVDQPKRLNESEQENRKLKSLVAVATAAIICRNRPGSQVLPSPTACGNTVPPFFADP